MYSIKQDNLTSINMIRDFFIYVLNIVSYISGGSWAWLKCTYIWNICMYTSLELIDTFHIKGEIFLDSFQDAKQGFIG